MLVGPIRPVQRVKLESHQQNVANQVLNLPNDCTSQTEVFTPNFGGPSLEESLKEYLGLGVQAAVSKKTVIGRQWKYDLSWSSDKMTTCFLFRGLIERNDSESRIATSKRLVGYNSKS